MSSLNVKAIEKSTYFIVEHNRTSTHLLEEAFKIQRIKFTSYDASKNYVVFGANIGSLYVYHVENITKCIKVLPSSLVKPIKIISISPNESDILFADETGMIIILEKCLSEKPYETHVFNQQKGKSITAVKWDDNNNAYIGNTEGTIAVVSIKSKLIFSLLHTPYVSLMDLQSRIVQIDVLSPLLLVTTDKKTFICNTEQERYRQVGTQDTTKGFGACFICNTRGINLYCSRPGLRLWQANVRGDVFSTQIYKGVDSLITEILRFAEGTNDSLQVDKLIVPNEDKISFGKVQLFSEKFLCIINSENIYILDPEDRRVIFHYYCDNGMDVRLVKQRIYIRFSTGKILILSLYKLEELMNEIYFKKQYNAGIRFLLRYRNLSMSWLKRSPNVRLITNLEYKMKNVDNELAHQFISLLNEFRKWENESMKIFLEVEDPNTNLNKELKVDHLKEQLSEEMDLMCKKYDLFKTCNIIYMPQFTFMLLAMNEDEMAELFSSFIDYQKLRNVDVEMYWCYKEFIHHFDLKKGHKKFVQLKKETKNFLKESYMNVENGIDINTCSNTSCTYPVPSSKRGQPKHDKVGKVLVKFYEDDTLYKKKPYAWYHRLNKISDKNDLKSNLPAILQFGYISALQKFKKYVTYNFCYDMFKLFLTLKRGKCLNCGTAFAEEYLKNILEWEEFGFALIPLIGPDNVLRIFSDFQQHIAKKDALSEKFFLGCVFSEIHSKELKSKNSIEIPFNFLSNAKTQTEFRDCLSTYLMAKADKTKYVRAISTKEELTCGFCHHCKTILQHPVFKEVQQLKCGHAFHAICLHFNNNVCTVCSSN